jgi:transglutaminase elicitor
MNTRHPLFWFFVALFASFLAVFFIAETAATQSQKSGNLNSTINHLNGLRVITFSLNPGKIKVYLPDDIAPGDTISGTLETEPNGSTAEERAQNQELLNHFTLELEGTKTDVKQPSFLWLPPAAQSNAPGRYRVNVSDSEASYDYILEVDPGNKSLGGEWLGESRKDHPDFVWLPLGQQGRPNTIYGPFDGRFTTTQLRVGDGEVRLLAESPRKAIFQSPNDVVGPTQITLKEGNADRRGNYRNLSVRLSAPKTNLLKGERTTMQVEVLGLQGIKDPVPLTLDSMGVITMEGGMYQPLMIQPSQVGSDGRFTTTRGITGVQTGAWTSTATVVTTPFDLCLEDELTPQRTIVFNSLTGKFQLCAPGNSFGGSGTIAIKGNILTLKQNARDRRVLISFNADTVREGNAQVKTSNPKQAFTITDRDTRNNACTCR